MNKDEEIKILKLALSNKEAQLTEQNLKLTEQDLLINHLKARIEKLLLERYGKKTEKIKPLDYPQFDEPELTPDEVSTLQTELVKLEAQQSVAKRKALPSELARIEAVHDLKDADKICQYGHTMHRIGQETSEKLEGIATKAYDGSS